MESKSSLTQVTKWAVDLPGARVLPPEVLSKYYVCDNRPRFLHFEWMYTLIGGWFLKKKIATYVDRKQVILTRE